jgi:tetratricopeptide (TPR) repeat protein
MEGQRPVHRTIVVVDVEGFGDRHRTNRHQLAIREGLYRVVGQAFRQAGIPWDAQAVGDRGDGLLILLLPEVHKSLLVELLPAALVQALGIHNGACPSQERIRLRMAVHAGEISYDAHGVTGAAVNLTFRLADAEPLKMALTGSPGVLAIIVSSWFFEEVVRHSAVGGTVLYRPAAVTVKETTTTGWICLPDQQPSVVGATTGERSPDAAVPDLAEGQQLAGTESPAMLRQEMAVPQEPQEPPSGGARGRALAPLGDQLSDDLAHLQGPRVESVAGRVADVFTEVRAKLGDALAIAVPTAIHSLPADVATFTGRQAEMDRLLQALPSRESTGGVVRIDAIDGMAGVGKTAFAVHAAHHLAPMFPDGQLFVRLHAHTSTRRPAEPADVLASLLLAIGVAPQQVPAGLDERAGLWRDRMAGRGALLLLDDATGSEQVRPLLPGTAGTLVLVTSRRRLAGLPEALAVTLDVLEAGEAARLFARLADRPGLLPLDEAVVKIVDLCGSLPLAISLMAGQLKYHLAWTAVDMAVDLGSAANRLSLMGVEDISVAAAVDLSYRNLPADQQRFFHRLGLHPGPDIDVYAAAALNDTDAAVSHRILNSLFGYHLIEEPVRGRYRFHDLIREHARALAAEQVPAEREAAVTRLMDYYLHTAQKTTRHFDRRISRRDVPLAARPPTSAPRIDTPEQARDWISAELPNLNAATHYAAHHESPGHAIALAAALAPFLRTYGPLAPAAAMHEIARDTARRTGDRAGQATALTDLGIARRLMGPSEEAREALSEAADLYGDLGDHVGQAEALTELGTVQYLTGAYAQAEDNLARALGLYRSLGSQVGEANTLTQTGDMEWLTGAYTRAEDNLNQALHIYRELGHHSGQATALTKLGCVQRATGAYARAADSLALALGLYRQLGDRFHQADALSELGMVQWLTGAYRQAEENLTQALGLYRVLGSRVGQANALTYLGGVQPSTGAYTQAQDNLVSALELFRLLGNRNGQATASMHLGAVYRMKREYALAEGALTQALDLFRELGSPGGEAETLNQYATLIAAIGTPAQARALHIDALHLAREINARQDEANALDGIASTHQAEGNAAEARTYYRQALNLYRSMGCLADTARVQSALERLEDTDPQAGIS